MLDPSSHPSALPLSCSVYERQFDIDFYTEIRMRTVAFHGRGSALRRPKVGTRKGRVQRTPAFRRLRENSASHLDCGIDADFP